MTGLVRVGWAALAGFLLLVGRIALGAALAVVLIAEIPAFIAGLCLRLAEACAARAFPAHQGWRR